MFGWWRKRRRARILAEPFRPVRPGPKTVRRLVEERFGDFCLRKCHRLFPDRGVQVPLNSRCYRRNDGIGVCVGKGARGFLQNQA